MTSAPIQIGVTKFEHWHDLEISGIKAQLAEIDPNLLLMRHPEGGYAVLHNDAHGQWYAVCVNKNPSRESLQALPSILRERNARARHNQKESALERDIRSLADQQAAREKQQVQDLTAQADRVYHALRKDIGHHLGVTKSRFTPLR